MTDEFVLGIDGCKAGWCVCRLDYSGNWALELFPDFQSVWNKYHNAASILIDIPIGLSDAGHRQCDLDARELLGPKWASIFLTPCRNAVYAGSYREACTINNETCNQKISKQAWALSPKVREVDEIMCINSGDIELISESHPELCFQALNHGQPLLFSKKHYNGIKERLGLLQSLLQNAEDIVGYGEATFKRSQVVVDDMVDAMCLAVCALHFKQELQSIPSKLQLDRYKIPMNIVLPNIKH